MFPGRPHMVYIGNGLQGPDFYFTHQGMTMNMLLDNLFYLGQIASLLAMAWGAWLVLRNSLAGIVFPAHLRSSLVMSLSAALIHPFRRTARV